MLIKEKINSKVNYVKLEEPRKSNDFFELMEVLNNLLQQEDFSIIFEVVGKSYFTKEQKKEFGKWFKVNKQVLGKHCNHFIRINNNPSKISRLSSKAMSLAMPFPYTVVRNIEEARIVISN